MKREKLGKWLETVVVECSYSTKWIKVVFENVICTYEYDRIKGKTSKHKWVDNE